MSRKTRFIVRAAMMEYMVLMAGALMMYGALQIWPHAVGVIVLTGGVLIALLCVANLYLILRTSSLPLQSREGSRRDR